MKNLDINVDGKTLTIKIDLTKTHGATKSGKNILVASTEGNQPVAEGLSLGLNLYKKPA